MFPPLRSKEGKHIFLPPARLRNQETFRETMFPQLFPRLRAFTVSSKNYSKTPSITVGYSLKILTHALQELLACLLNGYFPTELTQETTWRVGHSYREIRLNLQRPTRVHLQSFSQTLAAQSQLAQLWGTFNSSPTICIAWLCISSSLTVLRGSPIPLCKMHSRKNIETVHSSRIIPKIRSRSRKKTNMGCHESQTNKKT